MSDHPLYDPDGMTLLVANIIRTAIKDARANYCNPRHPDAFGFLNKLGLARGRRLDPRCDRIRGDHLPKELRDGA